jgi:uncharacterized protein YrzB (UPF0473 family)
MRKIAIIALMTLMAVTANAQKKQYDVICTAPYDARTQQYGKVEAQEYHITRNGDKWFNIHGRQYQVVSIDARSVTDEKQYTEYTVRDDDARQYILKIVWDSTATPELRKHYVILVDTNNPYDWTYYFIGAPREVK